MPIYEYACPHGHILDHPHRFSDGERPATIVCAKHNATATYQISLPAPGRVAGSDNPIRPSREWTEEERADKQRPCDLGTFDYHCDICDVTFNALVDFRAGETSEAPRPCPTCGALSSLTLSMSHVDGTLRMYPYFDRGLDCVVESAQHRRDLCKERHLIPVDGDYDASRMFNELRRPGREAEAEYHALLKTQWDDPPMRAYRDDYKARTGREMIPPF